MGPESERPPAEASEHDPWQLRLPRVPRHAVPRDAIEQQLNRGAPLTLVHAPPGFGKTLAVTQWVRRHVLPTGMRTHWVDAQFTTTASVNYWHAVGPLPESTDPAPEQPGRYPGWTALRISEGVPVLLVLDSAQNVPDGAFLSEVVDIAARYDYFRAVVISRSPDLPGLEELHRIDVTQIDSSLLRFNVEETGQALAARGVELAEDRRSRLHRGLGGWPTLVGRAAHFLDQPSALPTADPVAVERRVKEIARTAVDYLADSFLPEVAAPEVLELATRAAVLREVSPDTLGVLLGSPEDGARALEDLHRAGLLATAGAATSFPETIRRAMLRRRERLGLGPDEELQRAVVRHHLDQEQHRLALEQALALDDTDFLAEIVADHWFWVYLSHTDLLERAVARIPAEVLDRNPRAAAAHEAILGMTAGSPDPSPLRAPGADVVAMAANPDVRAVLFDALTQMTGDRVTGRVPAAAELAHGLAGLAEACLDRGTPGVGDVVPMALVQSAVSLQLANDLTRAAELMTTAHALADDDPSELTGRNAEGALAMTHVLWGNLPSAREWSRQHTRHAPYPGVMGRRVDTAGQIGELLLAMEDLDVRRAQELVDLLARERLDDELFGYAMLAVSHFALLWGQPGMMLEVLLRVREERASHAGPGTAANLTLRLAKLDQRLALGHGSRAALLLRNVPESDRRHPSVVIRRARLALLTDDLEGCLAEGVVGLQPGARHRVELGLLHAAAHLRRRDTDRAGELFHDVLRLAMPLGLALPFAMIPRGDLEGLLKVAGDTETYVTGLLDGGLPAAFAETLTIVNLTDRERELLDAIVAGLSNEEMAGTIFVSTNTIKTQLRGLYRKVGATSRRDVLHRARLLGLLE